MIGHSETFAYKMRFLLAGTVVVASLLVLTVLLAVLVGNTVQAKEPASSTAAVSRQMSSSPNVITSGMVKATDEFGQAMESTEQAISSGLQSFASATVRGSKVAARGVQTAAVATARGVGTGVMFVGRIVGSSALFVGRTVGSGVMFVGRTLGTGVAFVFGIPGSVVGFVSNTQVVEAVIRPAEEEQVPIIDPNSPELRAAIAALPATPTPKAASRAPAPKASGPAWPMRGDITTEFGVPHRPYQPVHTGIDITDRRRSGVTPIRPFRPGRVVDTIYSRYGLGNHVIVDHGKGVTSVYAHLSSISVKEGQKVGMDSVLGREGTTGLSTGVHLHFEIRVNGQAADPRKFISGNP
jgi:murein DD-endopeptidase MepM/ murein hydrolase activator NlpD